MARRQEKEKCWFTPSKGSEGFRGVSRGFEGGFEPQVVTMSLNTVPPVDCKRTAAAAGLSSRLARSDRGTTRLYGYKVGL